MGFQGVLVLYVGYLSFPSPNDRRALTIPGWYRRPTQISFPTSHTARVLYPLHDAGAGMSPILSGLALVLS